MARKDETGVPEFLIPFQVDQSWYERYWWQDPARREGGLFAFFRRILSQQRSASADPGKVDPGSPTSICANAKNPEHVPFPSNRHVL